ncbi:MAG: hypothetical protein ABH842_00010 [Candidatus Micrarchaeota archaeon]
MHELTLEEAKLLWDKFVPEKQVWTDDWNIRVALCKAYGCNPLILFDGTNFFPLQFDPEDGFYTILGGDSVEKNYLTFDPEFMKVSKDIPDNIYFDFLVDKFTGCIEGVCPQFFIDLTKVDSTEDYLKRFSTKHRKNFKNSYKKFGSFEFKKEGNLEKLAELNMAMFGAESDFVNGTRACYTLLDVDSRTEYWSVLKDGKFVSVFQYFFYDKTMSVCVWGMDDTYSDGLKIAFTETIKLAKSRGCTRIDYAPTYSSWKFLYRLDIAPLWRYKKGTIPDSVDITEYGIPEAELKKLKEGGRI